MADGKSAHLPAPVCKRYTEFSLMHTKLRTSGLPHAENLPALPSKGGMFTFLRGRQNKKVIEQREHQFAQIVEFISHHRELATSVIFQSFVSS
uniref:PX domain-containing protein n=1 Tax=Globisporangium ultimum (strain ATCC 200006 / CBS 805.95 / DAOM BR144) TaxID=431595 RepID=K3XBM9_GLOUD